MRRMQAVALTLILLGFPLLMRFFGMWHEHGVVQVAYGYGGFLLLMIGFIIALGAEE